MLKLDDCGRDLKQFVIAFDGLYIEVNERMQIDLNENDV